MRVPIQRATPGTFYIQIDLEQTPSGFEDAWESSDFVRRLNENRSVGEFSSPDVSALVGNELATLYRQRRVDGDRTAIIFGRPMYYGNRFIQLEVKPYGRLGKTFETSMTANPQDAHYITFRLGMLHDDELDEERVVGIWAADYTHELKGPYNR